MSRRLAPRPALGASLALLAALAGCDDDPQPPPDQGAAPTACGDGPARVQLGVGQPFTALPSLAFPVEAGLQGGYHIDVSLRVEGRLDPDRVDVQLRLFDGDTLRARHDTAEWFFLVAPELPACDYPRARLVLEDGAGGLLGRGALGPLLGRPLRLEVRLASPLGQASHTATITLSPPPEEG